MKLEIASFTTTDKLELPALLYSPKSTTKAVLIWLHGASENGVFYNPHVYNPLGSSLAKKGVALLAFNNRGAHHRKKIRVKDDSLPEEKRYIFGGVHYEKIAQCLYDINGAVKFLKARGYKKFYLGGHSTGANKICVYHSKVKSNPFSKYILTGPGDDSGIYYKELGAKRFNAALRYAHKSIIQNKPFKVMPKYSGMNPFSARSALDIMDPNGQYNSFPFFEATNKRLGKKPLFKEYSKINLPMLVIMGENDEYTYTACGSAQALNLLKNYANKSIIARSSFVLMEGADHGFKGLENKYADLMANWLDNY